MSRHQNVDTGAKFLEEAIKLDPENEGAFHYLRDAYGRKGGDWDRVLVEPGDQVDLGPQTIEQLAILRLTEVDVHAVDMNIGITRWSDTFAEVGLPLRVARLGDCATAPLLQHRAGTATSSGNTSMTRSPKI